MTNPGPTVTELDTILTIGARVPDHGKLAPWRFIVFDGDARARAGNALALILEGRGSDADRIAFTKGAFLRAPVVVAVVSSAGPHPKIPEWEQVLSAGAVCMNLCHAAHALGYVANWLTDWFAYDAAALPVLGLKDGERVAGFVYIGTAAEPPQERPRPALTDIVTRWSGG